MKNKSLNIPSSMLMPQEEKLELKSKFSELTIGVPKEHTFQENRTPLCPDGVQLIVNKGIRVLVERGVGYLAGFRDNEYSEAGAEIVDTPLLAFNADIVLKVSPPTLQEISMMNNCKTLISALHYTVQTQDYFKLLMQKKISAFAYEFIKDNTGLYPVLFSMSEITGNTSIQIASEYLCRTDLGRGVILGSVTGVPPSEVVIIGAGTVGEYAARAALGLGAVVKVFDNKLYKLKTLQSNLGTRLFTSIIHPKIISKALKTTDVLIGALHSKMGRTNKVVTENMVLEMKPGAVIIDASIDQGGCVETSIPTTHNNPVFQYNGVTHYCVPNIPSRVPRTASFALSNFFTPLICDIVEFGSIENYIYNEQGFRNGAYVFNGIVTNANIAENFNLPHKNIELLMAAFLFHKK